MNKCLVALWLMCFPLLAMAASTTGTSALSLTPPPSDYSVIFLGNLFGIVDGVLHGTGSQIMGAIFTVFNSAVLALGGIVIMYTLIVGTMNTAHEGEMLGHKWSSIWIPVRSTAGLALLIPKASGYCLMQIFVMWVVVQGVGAADKVWAAALDYLNRGGVIIQTSINPATSMAADGSKLAQGASAILAGEVCMFGLQKVLEAARTEYLALAGATPSLGPCGPNKKTNGLAPFCDTVVPDLLATFDAPGFQTANPGLTSFSLPLPYFAANSASPYAFLNEICGNITWNRMDPIATPGAVTSGGQDNSRLSAAYYYQPTDSQADTTEMISLSRATAIQQMYFDYQAVAQAMVNNDPEIVPPSNNSTSLPACPPQATNVFGIPYSSNSAMPCAANATDCVLWQGGPVCSNSKATNKFATPIFNGTELQNGIADYNGVMMPTLNLITQLQTAKSASQARAFIAKAKSQGWLSAGSYFFDLVKISGSATASANLTDTNTGLEGSNTAGNLLSAFDGNTCASSLCTWLTAGGSNVNIAYNNINKINRLLGTKPLIFTPGGEAVKDSEAATTYGFIKNSLILQLPGQPPPKGPKISTSLFPSLASATTSIDFGQPDCYGFKIKYVGRICFGRYMISALYGMFKTMSSVFTNILGVWINNMIIIIVSIPIGVLQDTFVTGVEYLTKHPGDNPIVVLAKMGVYYINAPANLYVSMITQSLAASYIPMIGPYILAVIVVMMGFAAPLIISWMGVMMTVGFTTAFYVPFVPYMIFTFGVIAWFMAVIEAMAAAPIVALSITHPEGEGILGNKGETALMILMNVFLRPAMMIIGYISAIALSYVSVWIINTGFANVISFIKDGKIYNGWAGLFVLFFSVVIYTSMYVTVVQKAFNLIYQLPDHVLRWIGGHQEGAGAESARWAEEQKTQIKEASDASKSGASGVLEKTFGEAAKRLKKDDGGGKKGATSVKASGK